MIVRFKISNIVTLVLLFCLFCILYNSRSIFMIAIFGALFAYILYPIAIKLTKLKLPYFLSTLLVLFFFMLFVFLFIAWVAPQLYKDVEILINNMPKYLDSFANLLEKIGNKVNIDLSKTALYERLIGWTKNSGLTIVKWLGGVALSLKKVFDVTLNLVVAPIIAVILLFDAKSVKNFMDEYINCNEPARTYVSVIANVMKSYFRGQFIVAIILACLYTLVLLIIKLDVAVLMGLLTGLLSIIPFLGFTVGIILSVLMAAIQYQDIIHPLYVVIGYAIVQVIESTLITPKIVGNSVGIHPTVTIVVLLVGSSVYGLIGMVFAVPISGIIFQIYKINFPQYIKSKKSLDKQNKNISKSTSKVLLTEEERIALEEITKTNNMEREI